MSKNGNFDTNATVQSSVFYWWGAYSVGGAFEVGSERKLRFLIPFRYAPFHKELLCFQTTKKFLLSLIGGTVQSYRWTVRLIQAPIWTKNHYYINTQLWNYKRYITFLWFSNKKSFRIISFCFLQTKSPFCSTSIVIYLGNNPSFPLQKPTLRKKQKYL